jgi:ferredoxin
VPVGVAGDRRLEVSVDRVKCCGYAVCVGLCPEVFDLDEDGLAQVLTSDIPAALEDSVHHAAASCPEAAISVTVTAAAPSEEPAIRG